MSEIRPGVIYRETLTKEDYEDAIACLKNAMEQPGRESDGCAVCCDSDHTAATCHHNPLVMARRAAAYSRMFKCYHCGFEAFTEEQAQEHFGHSDDEVARCLRQRADGADKVDADRYRGWRGLWCTPGDDGLEVLNKHIGTGGGEAEHDAGIDAAIKEWEGE